MRALIAAEGVGALFRGVTLNVLLSLIMATKTLELFSEARKVWMLVGCSLVLVGLLVGMLVGMFVGLSVGLSVGLPVAWRGAASGTKDS